MVTVIDDISHKTEPKKKAEPKNQYEKVIDALKCYTTAKEQYELLNLKKEYKEASLRLETDWDNAIPDTVKRITNDDKAAHITMVMKNCYTDLLDLELKKDYLKEIYEIEKMVLKKEGVIDG